MTGRTPRGRQGGSWRSKRAGRRRCCTNRANTPSLGTPTYVFLAFPGEEAPQIEGNEDAGGQDTEE